jgi:hypothetical protein
MCFVGLYIKIGDNLTGSGGEAFADKNAIVLFGRARTLLSLEEAETIHLFRQSLQTTVFSDIVSVDTAQSFWRV